MKQIKFRAWDKEDKEMIYPTTIPCGKNYEKELGYIYQQYTGLKDKNGKEIYEGDILFNANDKHNYEMIWNKSDACFMLGEDGGRLSKFVLSEFWEVIGNIYENKDLVN